MIFNRLLTKNRFLMILSVFTSVGCLFQTNLFAQASHINYNPLTPEEKRVILQKGTEMPFSGKYHTHNADGIYICKRCNAPLYRSDDKFDSRLGWPSFDDEIADAIKRQPDLDGVRTEIVCRNCGAHLGHVFVGENLTPKNVRHCVNSISLDFVPQKNIQKAYFAAGCFWGVEYHFKNTEGVLFTRVGYMGGHKKKPTYFQVCLGNTGHAETLEVEYDSSRTKFETLAKLFFEIHDPTQVNRQGPDRGVQYRSAIFYVNDSQRRIAKKLIQILEAKGYKIATKLTKAKDFWEAEDYHQDYYSKNGKTPYCHTYQKRF